MPDELLKTTDEVYIRFHGQSRWFKHDYSKREMKEWTEKIKQSGAKCVWAYFNNDYNSYSADNAKTLMKILRKKLI